MKTSVFSGSAQITDEGIKKHFKSYEPVQAIFELVWNGLDAGATEVKVNIIENDLDGIESVTVIDNGEGIDVKNVGSNFEKFNESLKRHDDDKHGSHGKGRLAFHRLSEKAIWFTRREDYDAKITIESSAIKDFSGTYLEKEKQHASLVSLDSGTCVELVHFKKNKLPTEQALMQRIGQEFCWFLALNKSRTIYLNGKKVTIPKHEIHETDFEIDSNDFSVKVIRWENKPGSEKSHNYFIDKNNKVVLKELSRFNNKVKFHSSAFVFSKWIDGFDPDGLEMDLQFSKSSPIYREVLRELLRYQREIYQDFLRKYVDEELDRFEANGYFPELKNMDDNYVKWRTENTKSVVKEIYLADPTIFNKLNAKQSKILIRLLDKILVSNENDSLFDVLDGVLDLDSENMSLLAHQLSKTTLENIISTIETLQKRQISVHKLREIMENRFNEVLETPDLQKIIENNTWLFGPQYTTLGAEEDSFQKIAVNLRNDVKDIDVISTEDIEAGSDVNGINRQVDLFLARKIPTYDSQGGQYYKCVIVEIKRPGVSLNKKHLSQLEDYADIIEKHPAFSSDKMRFELILIGRKISKDDVAIKRRLRSMKEHAEYGLVATGRIKCYVKDWFTIFDEFDLSNNYLLDRLNTKLDEITDKKTENLVNDLQEGAA